MAQHLASSADDDGVWEQLKATAIPLKHRHLPQQTMLPPKLRAVAPRIYTHVSFAPYQNAAALIIGDISQLDGAAAQRLRRGTYSIDAKLDLHGMTRENAREALTQFIQTCYAQKRRCLLVITGKGSNNQPGVIRSAFGSWLNLPDLRPMVLAAISASQKHGGSGAFYVLLKRQR